MLWVEQPVGTGFTTGNATATSEEEIAQDFVYVDALSTLLHI